KNKVQRIKLGDKHKSVFYLYGANNKVWASRHGSDTLLQIDNATNEIKHYHKPQGIFAPAIVTKRSPKGNLYSIVISLSNYIHKYNPEKDKFENISKPVAAKISANWQVTDLAFDKNEKVYLGTNHGLFVLDSDSLRKVPLDRDYEIKSVFFDQKNILWVGTDVGLLRQQHDHFILFSEFNGLSSKTMTYRAMEADSLNRIWVATANGVCFSQLEVVEKRQTSKPIFLMLRSNGQRIVLDKPNLLFQNNTVLVGTFVAMNFPTDRILYQYRISNINNNEWTSPEKSNELIIPNLNFGDYKLEIRALQQGGYDWSEPLYLSFKVEKPMYLQWWAILGYIAAAFGVIWAAAKFYGRKLEQEKEHLEQVVTERTEKIKQQSDAIMLVHQTLEKKNKDIVASINYAKRIQDAMLPSLQDFESRFGKDNFFVLFKPRDIVSGDF
ncbi:MAG: triple tyrosine motif-containing protein, partial [Thermoflexibacteraceae bacterium]